MTMPRHETSSARAARQTVERLEVPRPFEFHEGPFVQNWRRFVQRNHDVASVTDAVPGEVLILKTNIKILQIAVVETHMNIGRPVGLPLG